MGSLLEMKQSIQIILSGVFRGFFIVAAASSAMMLFTASETCGLTCPVCTGDLVAPAGDLAVAPVTPHGTWAAFALWSPQSHEAEGENGSATVMTGLWNRFEIGLTYGFGTDDYRLRLKGVALNQSDVRPAVVFGLGNLRPGSTETNGYVLLNWRTFGSVLPRAGGYLGVGTRVEHQEPQLFAGVSYSIGGRTGAMASFDGRDPHLGLMVSPLSSVNIGMMAVEMKDLSPMVGARGNLPWGKRI